MNRLWVRILVFGSLLGAAGLVWGVMDAALFTPVALILIEDIPRPKQEWALLLSFAVLFFALWLAARLVTRDSWEAVSVVSTLQLPIMSAVFLPAACLCALTNPGTRLPLLVLVSLIIGSGVLHLLYMCRMRQQRKLTPDKPKPKFPKSWFAAIAGICIVALLLANSFSFGESEWFKSFQVLSPGGFSLLIAWQIGLMGLIDFGRWLAISMIVGAAFGLVTGALLSFDSQRIGTAQTALRRAAIGFPIGAVLSGLMFGAHAVLLLQVYRVAWDPHALLITSLWVWGIVGAIAGLILACAVHVMTGEPDHRVGRLPIAFALTIPPIIVASAWATSFVRIHDAGRELLMKAARLEGQAMCVGFRYGTDSKPTVKEGKRIIWVQDEDKLSRLSDRRNCVDTIRLCDELLEKHADSAYRSAALYLKYWSDSFNWQPREALQTLKQLNTEYPRQGYWPGMTRRREISNLALLGDYDSVVRKAREYARGQSSYEPDRTEVYAAEVLGLWDDAARMQRDRIARLNKGKQPVTRRQKERLAGYQERLDRIKAQKSKNAGPQARADVTGRVVLRGRPFPGAVVCLVPTNALDKEDKYLSPAYVASCGGLLGTTDDAGAYRVKGVPSGKYEILLIVETHAPRDEYAVEAPGAPYRVEGRSARLPDITLTPPVR